MAAVAECWLCQNTDVFLLNHPVAPSWLGSRSDEGVLLVAVPTGEPPRLALDWLATKTGLGLAGHQNWP